jgi:hypothetical protein
MKTNILILATLLMVQLANCQYFNKSSNWTVIKTNAFDESYRKRVSYKVLGDSIVGGKEYLKVYINDAFRFLMRESGEGIVYVYQPSYEKDLVVYDFNWSEGKTLEHQFWEEPDEFYPYISINTIDSIKLLDDKYYKCLKIDDKVYCIQGLGGMQGFFRHMFPIPTDGTRAALLCFFHGDQLIYSNTDYKDCSSIRVDVENEMISEQVLVYPQPSGGIVTFEFPKLQFGKVNQLKIFSESGKLVCSQQISNINQITISDLNDGVYIYSFLSQEKQMITGKFIVKK